MKKSRFNILKKIDGYKHIIFNSFSLAMARVDNDFFGIYDNLENIDLDSFSEKQREIYNTMSKSNFIVADETDELKDLEFFRLSKNADSHNLSLVLHPTLSCNFDCYYCYEKNKSGLMSKDVLEKILELIKKHAEKKSNITIEWFGGEPLLAFDIIYDFSQKAIDICKKNSVKYFSALVTNGYLFTDDIIDKLKDCNISKVQITLDGPPDIHNKRRFLKNSKEPTFDRILENADKLNKKKINLRLRVNINKEISMNSMMQFVKILNEYDLSRYITLAQETDLDPEKKSCVNDCSLTDEGFAHLNFDFCKRMHDLGIQELESSYPEVIFTFCGYSKINSYCIDPEGYMYKCETHVGMHEKAVRNIMDDTYNENFFNNNVKYMTWNHLNFKKCRECNILPICSGNCPNLGSGKNEPQCITWKYNIEDLIDTIASHKK
jgi:uncharacterized protein